MSEPKQYCFCTLAVGKRYRTHAKMLAEDMQKHAPTTAFVLLSDKPDEFKQYANVQAFLHRTQSVKGYHDKRFVLEKALSLFESCIFVDADIRMLGPVPEDIRFLPGIVARYGCGIVKHNATIKLRKSFEPIQVVAKTLELNLEDVLWFHEFMFLVSRQQGEKEFFRLWQSISYYFESQGVYGGAGNVMGLAAAKAGFDIHFHRHDFFPAFKDNIQKEKIKEGKADPKSMAAEFKVHREIEYPQRSLPQKVTHKVSQNAALYYRLLRRRFQSPKDAQFRAFSSIE
ncbi:MAG: hypothetical protein WBB01_18995 [Phormidesmis sp.]